MIKQPTLFDLPSVSESDKPQPRSVRYMIVHRINIATKSKNDDIIWRSHDNGHIEWITRSDIGINGKKPRRWKSIEACHRFMQARYRNPRYTVEVWEDD